MSAPISDRELERIYQEATDARWEAGDKATAVHRAGLAAVRDAVAKRAALQEPVAVPEWAHRFTIVRLSGEWCCWAVEDIDAMRSVSRVGTHPTDPIAAIRNAVEGVQDET